MTNPFFTKKEDEKVEEAKAEPLSQPEEVELEEVVSTTAPAESLPLPPQPKQ